MTTSPAMLENDDATVVDAQLAVSEIETDLPILPTGEETESDDTYS